MTRTIVAIDGTVGSGKSTVASLVAGRLGLVHIDTGATYRLVGRQTLAEGVAPEDAAAAAEVAGKVAAATVLGPDGTLRFEGRPVGQDIRTPEVSRAASLVAAHPEVRRIMVELQRSLVPPGGAVVEGRDIGTVVWPSADLKVFLDAREDVRTGRRAEEGAAVAERDRRDAGRPVGAMRPAPDALLVDTSERTPEQVAEEIVSRLPRRAQRPNALYRVVRGALSALVRGPFRLEATGEDNIPAAGPAILAPNHRSLADIPVAGVLTKRQVWFMAKDELFESSIGRSFFTKMGAFPVRRGKPDRTPLLRALELLKQGELVGIYPEGTRRPDARFDEVEEGLAYVALKSGAPIVPIALSGTESIQPPGRKLPRFVKLRARVGEPFTLGGPVHGILSRARIREATDLARRRLQAVMDELEPRS